MQCWALANIPTCPGIFPCNALYTNFDHLLWRAKELGVPGEILDPFPWILWFIWKGRNNFLFNGVDSTPADTLQVAMTEAGNWKVAQIIPTVEEEAMQDVGDGMTRSAPVGDRERYRCQVDASWVKDGSMAGVGFVLIQGETRKLMGMQNSRTVTSPLVAEAEGLLWAMRTMIREGHTSVHFESDCVQLIKLVQQVEEWPAMAEIIEEICFISQSFELFSIAHLPRGMNKRVDCLAKAARTRNDLFSLVCVETPVWLAQVASLLES